MQQKLPHLHIVLLCDDFGEKLWPLARKNAPIFLSNLGGNQQQSLLMGTFNRVKNISDAPVHIVATQTLAKYARKELIEHKLKNKKDFEMLVVPEDAGNAFSVAMASAYVRRNDPNAIMAVFPVNQTVETDERWDRLLYKAYLLAVSDYIAIIGGTQKERCYDNTYIRKSKPIPDSADAFEVGAFLTGSTNTNAKRMVGNGAMWYTGIYFARAAELLGALSNATATGGSGTADVNRTAEIAKFLAQLEPKLWLKKDAYELLSSVPKLSYEQAVLEVSHNRAVLPSTLKFSTLIDYGDIAHLTKAGEKHNFISKNVSLDSCRHCTVYGENEGKEIKLVGVNNLVVIDTPEGLLISERHR